MQFFNEETTKQIKERMSKMDKAVKFILFITEKDPKSNEVMESFLGEMCASSDKLTLEKSIVEKEQEKSKEYGVYAVPCFALVAEEKRKVIYYGVPMGNEFSTFLLDIIDVSTGKPNISGDLVKKIEEIKEPMHLQVFVTDSCPHCPHAAKPAHDIAIINPNVQADVIDAAQFQPIAQAFRITSVPTTIVDKKYALRGAMPLDVMLHKIEEAKKGKQG